jgi:hypothetical protein
MVLPLVLYSDTALAWMPPGKSRQSRLSESLSVDFSNGSCVNYPLCHQLTNEKFRPDVILERGDG